MWNDLWTGDLTLYPPEVALAQHANHGQSENRPVGGQDFHTAREGIMCGWIAIPACDPIVPG